MSTIHTTIEKNRTNIESLMNQRAEFQTLLKEHTANNIKGNIVTGIAQIAEGLSDGTRTVVNEILVGRATKLGVPESIANLPNNIVDFIKNAVSTYYSKDSLTQKKLETAINAANLTNSKDAKVIKNLYDITEKYKQNPTDKTIVNDLIKAYSTTYDSKILGVGANLNSDRLKINEGIETLKNYSEESERMNSMIQNELSKLDKKILKERKELRQNQELYKAQTGSYLSKFEELTNQINEHIQQTKSNISGSN